MDIMQLDWVIQESLPNIFSEKQTVSKRRKRLCESFYFREYNYVNYLYLTTDSWCILFVVDPIDAHKSQEFVKATCNGMLTHKCFPETG